MLDFLLSLLNIYLKICNILKKYESMESIHDIEMNASQFCKDVNYDFENKTFPQNKVYIIYFLFIFFINLLLLSLFCKILHQLMENLHEETLKLQEAISTLSYFIQLSKPAVSKVSLLLLFNNIHIYFL